jgi:Na+/proline symporter
VAFLPYSWFWKWYAAFLPFSWFWIWYAALSPHSWCRLRNATFLPYSSRLCKSRLIFPTIVASIAESWVSALLLLPVLLSAMRNTTKRKNNQLADWKTSIILKNHFLPITGSNTQKILQKAITNFLRCNLKFYLNKTNVQTEDFFLKLAKKMRPCCLFSLFSLSWPMRS